MTKQIDLEAEIQRLLTEHDRVAEQGITVHRREVETPPRRDEIGRQISGHFPEIEITCDIGITRAQAPSEVEEIS
jgi:hypothetical protein